jgi:glutamate-5-semialdehyde dehydrogenase
VIESDVHPDVRTAVRAAAARAKEAAAALAVLPRGVKDAALSTMADALLAASSEVLAANDRDVQAGRAAGLGDALLDRLALTEERIAAMAEGLRKVAALPDPVGEVVRGATLPSGLEVRQVRVPLGVVAMVYEARPNVTVDAAGLCLKAGNAALLRGSATARHSNERLVEVLADAAAKAGLPEGTITLVPGSDRESVTHLIGARGLVDVVIPRGGAGLISHVVENSAVPVIETGVGNCHVYVDASAELEMATRIVVNGKIQRPSVCNATETVLVHRDVAGAFVPMMVAELTEQGVRIHGDPTVLALAGGAGHGVGSVVPAVDEDWATEYLSLDLAVRVVDTADEAIAHIRRWGTGHTETIVATDIRVTRHFVARMDCAAVMVNASPRFTDGEQLGFGAEIGISTQKLHARGPMGLTELTSTTYVVTGDGQTRP